LIEELWQNCDGSNWLDFFRKTYTYDGNNNLIEQLNQIISGSNWVNTIKDIYTYDTNNNMIEKIHYWWDGSNWSNEDRYTYTYDGDNNLIEEVLQFTDASSNWVNYSKDIYSYIPTGIEDYEYLVTAYSLSQKYPNPFNPSTIISYSVPEIEIVTLKVYDVLGSEVATLVKREKPVGSYEVEIDASRLPSGIYFYRLLAGDFIETKKMVLLK
jgi:hypothetical protein